MCWRWPSCVRRGGADVCHLRGLHVCQSQVCGSSATSRLREKTKLCCSTHALASAELGAGDGRRRKGGVSIEMSAPARAKTSSKGVASAPEKMETHRCTLSLGVAQVGEIRSRADAAKKGQRSHESQRLQSKAGRTRQSTTGRARLTKAGPCDKSLVVAEFTNSTCVISHTDHDVITGHNSVRESFPGCHCYLCKYEYDSSCSFF